MGWSFWMGSIICFISTTRTAQCGARCIGGMRSVRILSIGKSRILLFILIPLGRSFQEVLWWTRRTRQDLEQVPWWLFLPITTQDWNRRRRDSINTKVWLTASIRVGIGLSLRATRYCPTQG